MHSRISYLLKPLAFLLLLIFLAASQHTFADQGIEVEKEFDPNNISALYDTLYESDPNTRSATSPYSYYPNTISTGSIRPPINQRALKISLSEDGIYKITQQDIINAGIPISSANPNSIQMMHMGYDVSYRFNGDTDNQFEANEYVFFYGREFEGTKFDQQYSDDNVYWLWFNGTPSIVPNIAHQTGNPIVTVGQNTYVHDPEAYFTLTSLNEIDGDWGSIEPDSWYWLYMQKNLTTPYTKSYPIELEEPASSGTATITIEALSNRTATRTFEVAINAQAPITKTWTGISYEVLSGTIPNSNLINGTNTIDFTINTPPAPNHRDRIAINHVVIEYDRALRAVSDEIIFDAKTAGSAEFQISAFAEGRSNYIQVWNVTNPEQPIKIPLTATNIINNGATNTLTVGTNVPAGGRYIATTINNFRTPTEISGYTAPNLTPSAGYADWIAFTTLDFQDQANRLAAHRQNFSNLESYVVDVEDVYNQYGFGLQSPDAIHDYLADAYTNWSSQPQYAVIFGTGSLSPRGLACSDPGCGATTTANEPSIIPTYLSFSDRVLGLIPSDLPFVLLEGGDLTPDISIGRIPSDSLQETKNVVDKIIQHDAHLVNQAAHTQRLLFLSDNIDSGGDFCFANQQAEANVTANYTTTSYCLDNYLNNGQTVSDMNGDVFGNINTNGALIINYRGHGSVTGWAAGLASSNSPEDWDNHGLAGIILSADCLDGNFGYIDREALGETFLTLGDQQGSAAHWSSSGLGYSTEHDILHFAFYDAVFDLNMIRIGDAINYAKGIYDVQPTHESELYAFNLLGDPALPVLRDPTNTAPIAGLLALPNIEGQFGGQGTTETYLITITNNGTTSDTYTINTSDSNNNWSSLTGSPTTIVLAPGESQVIPVTVSIPYNTSLNEVNETTVSVTSTNDAWTTDDIVLQTTVAEFTSVSMTDSSTNPFSLIPLAILFVTILTLLTMKLAFSKKIE